MKAEAPSPLTTLFILFGASEWPYAPEFHQSEAFVNSASDLRNFILEPHEFGLPKENLLDLFKSNQSSDSIDKEIGDFLERRILELEHLLAIATLIEKESTDEASLGSVVRWLHKMVVSTGIPS